MDLTGSDGDVVIVGRIGKPFGNRGEVYVFSDPDLAESFEPGTSYGTASGPLTVATSHVHADRLIIAFEGVDGRDGAEAVRGRILTRPRAEVGLEAGVVWVADLVGRQVTDADGGLVGVVERVVDGHAHDYLVVARPDGGEAMLPMVDELLDWSGDPVVVQAMPGLLDPDEAW
jgi:16S rRNA processing protein RimM